MVGRPLPVAVLVRRAQLVKALVPMTTTLADAVEGSASAKSRIPYGCDGVAANGILLHPQLELVPVVGLEPTRLFKGPGF